jgi:hypothetical protein
LGATEVDLPAAGHESVMLSLSDKLPRGLHAFAVDVTAPAGTSGFRSNILQNRGAAMNEQDKPAAALGSVESKWGTADAGALRL